MTEYTIPPVRFDSLPMRKSELGDRVDWGLATHKVPEVWKRATGKGVRIGIIDTGASDHQDLPNPVFSLNTSRSRTVKDRQGHATHVAGIIAARADDKGIVGVAPSCEIGYVKGLDDSGSGSNAGLAKAIRMCVDEGCHIINCSWGGGFSPDVESAIEYAVRSGVIVVAAAGNGGERGVIAPGSSDHTLAVASYNRDGEISDFSAKGLKVDIAAPGEQITSTWLRGDYNTISGTSMAAPFVCGILALALELGLNITAESIADDLKDLIVDRGPVGHDRSWGWGVFDLGRLDPPQIEVFKVGPHVISWDGAKLQIETPENQ